MSTLGFNTNINDINTNGRENNNEKINLIKEIEIAKTNEEK